MPTYPLICFEIQKCYQNNPKFNSVYSRNNLTKINDEAYLISFDDLVLYVNGKNIIYFYNFGAEHIPKEVKRIVGNKTTITNIYRIQACDLIMWIIFYWIYWFYIQR